MKFWGVSQKNWGVRLINFMGFWGREGGGGAKMFENIFLENDRYGEQKPKMKNTKNNCKVRLGFRVKSSRS